MEATLNEQTKIEGVHKICVYDVSTLGAELLDNEIKRVAEEWPAIMAIKDPELKARAKAEHAREYGALVAEMKSKYFKREVEIKNIVVLAGRSVIANRLAGITSYTGIINYGLLGSGLTAPANTDTQLTAEVFRKLVANAGVSGHIAFLDFYFNKTEVSGTFNEFGTVIDGTIAINTGQLYTHALTGGWVKTTSESMTIAVQYNVN